MKKITATILVPVLVLAGTAALADDIHDALSELAKYAGDVSFSESIMSTVVDTAPPAGVYILASDVVIAVVEYHTSSTVRRYGLVPTGDATIQAASASVARELVSANVLPRDYMLTYIDANKGVAAIYMGDLSKNEPDEGLYNDVEPFAAFIENC